MEECQDHVYSESLFSLNQHQIIRMIWHAKILTVVQSYMRVTNTVYEGQTIGSLSKALTHYSAALVDFFN